jgi:ribosomal protein L37AE/L43A
LHDLERLRARYSRPDYLARVTEVVKNRGASVEAVLDTHRECPHCSERTMPVKRLLFSNHWCASCGALIGTHWFYSLVFFVLTVVVTLFTTIAILAQQGLYAAILLFPFPIGAIGYLRARFCPLEVKKLKESA